MIRPASAALLAAMCCAGGAEEQPRDPPPDLELIEFLGSFTTEDGELVDPTGWIADDEYIAATALKKGSEQEKDVERAN